MATDKNGQTLAIGNTVRYSSGGIADITGKVLNLSEETPGRYSCTVEYLWGKTARVLTETVELVPDE